VKAVWSNCLWVSKKNIPADPSKWAPEWRHSYPLLETAEGQQAQRVIQELRRTAEIEGDDPNSVGRLLTANDVGYFENWIDMPTHWGLLSGDEQKVKTLCAKYKLDIDDQRVSIPWPSDMDSLCMVMPPRPFQVEPTQKIKELGYGIFHADPAFGKTWVMVDLMVAYKQMTLVLVPNVQLAENIVERVRLGSRKNDGTYNFVTNALMVENKRGKKIVGMLDECPSADELFPICVSTWQQFSGPSGQRKLAELKKKFGLIICDEAHSFASEETSNIIGGFWARHKIGFTATPFRRDKKESILFDTIGGITVRAEAPSLPVISYMHETGLVHKPSPRPSMKDWSNALNWVAKSEERKDIVLDWLKEDVSAGRKVLVISERVKWCYEMADVCKKKGLRAYAISGGLGKGLR
jgi:superfamily II DNA or RNA helicase